MKRLMKIANLGPDYFQPGDVDIFIGVEEGVATIVNEEKIVHTEDYDGQYFTFNDNELAVMNWQILEPGIEEFDELPEEMHGYMLVIDIMQCEVRPEYRGTGVIWQLVDQFVEKIAMPESQQWEPEYFAICSTFENAKFKERLPAYIQEKMPGVNFKVFTY